MKKLNKVSDYWVRVLGNSANLIPGEELFFGDLLKISLTSSTILEIGIGRGRMANILKNEGVNARFFGLDLTSNVKRSGVRGIVADTRCIPLRDNCFDLTYSLGVVEHFPETRIAIREHVRVTKLGGYILVATPHFALLTPIRYIIYLLKDRKHGSFEEIKGRNIRKRLMKKYFEDAGISIIKSGFYGIWELDYFLRNYSIGKVILKLQRTPILGSYLYMMGQKKLELHTSC